MACRFEYKGKTYDQDGLAKELEKMLPSEAHQFIPGVQNLPNMPFKSSWPDLALKRIIRQAAENNMDSVSWTPGEAQAARYDLSKEVSRVYLGDPVFHGNNDVRGNLIVTGRNGNDLVTKKVASVREIEDLIGKEAADKLVNNPTRQEGRNHVLDGEGLKVGGEGMKAFYDKILVDKANAIAKKFGGKVEQSSLGDQGSITQLKDGFKVEYPGQGSSIFDTHGEAIRQLEKWQERNPTSNVHVLRITPQLRDAAINKGFSLFADSGRVGAPLTALTKVEHNPFTTTAFHGSPNPLRGSKIENLERYKIDELANKFQVYDKGLSKHISEPFASKEAAKDWLDKRVGTEFYSTPNPRLAGDYAAQNPNAKGQNITPLRLDTNDYHQINAMGKTWDAVNTDAIREANMLNKKGVVIRNVLDDSDPKNKTRGPQTVFITLDPSTARSKFAKFDPEKFHESGLLKASGLPIITDKDGKQLDHNLKPLTFDEQNALLDRNPLPTHKATEPDKPINKTALALAASKAAEYALWAARPSLGGPLWAASIVGNAAYNAAPIKQRREGQPLRYKLRPISHDPFEDDKK